MTIDSTVYDDATLTQVGQWVRVAFPDGTCVRVIGRLTDDREKQRDIVRAASGGIYGL